MTNSHDNNGNCQAFDRHIEDFKQWADTTSIMHEMLVEMRHDTKYLNYLPMIVDELKELRGTLLSAATGKNHLPLAATLPVIAAMAFCIVILGGLLYSSQNPGKNINLSPTSISTSDGHQHPSKESSLGQPKDAGSTHL